MRKENKVLVNCIDAEASPDVSSTGAGVPLRQARFRPPYVPRAKPQGYRGDPPPCMPRPNVWPGAIQSPLERKLRRQQFMSDHLRGARWPSLVYARRPARSRTLQRNKAASEIAPDIIQPRHSPIKTINRSSSIGYRQVRQLISLSFFWCVARTTQVFLATVNLIRVGRSMMLPARRCAKASLRIFNWK
jgi:hypothetical protein